MKTVTAKELLTLDVSEFKKEYEAWCRDAPFEDWYECIEEDFKCHAITLGITVESIHFRLSYSQGDGAAFTGRVSLAPLMKHLKLDEQYLALYLAVGDPGNYVNVEPHRDGSCIRTRNYDFWCSSSAPPAGVFSDLPKGDWRELIIAQETEADLEDVALNFCESLCDDLYKSLRDEYEYQTSEEQFIESCDANEVTFEIEEEDV